jgi:hypothetical protein
MERLGKPRHGREDQRLSEREVSNQFSRFMSEERKTPEMRATMTELERLRHSKSHVLATVILRL